MAVAVLWMSGAGPAAAQLDPLLAYDSSRPLDVRVVGGETKGDVRVEDVTFSSVAGEAPIQAYLVRPASGAGPFAGVLFVHWFAPPDPTSNRTQFLSEAEALARRGAVSLLVSTFWSDEKRYMSRKWEADFQNSVNQAKDLRRALDVLLAQPGVDPQRIGYVGHDYGAMFGAVVAAVDTRAKAHVHIAGTARFSDWYLFGSSTGVPKGDALKAFKEQMGQIEPVNVIGKAKNAFFFQFGEADHYTPRKDFIDLYMAAPDPKRIATYPAKHEMREDVIRFDRTVWLCEQLGLPVPKSLAE
jgi:dienelactone hydrolase